MPDDTITLVSTTDSAEEVEAALTEKPAAAPAAAPAAEPETEEQRETREASDAGGKLRKRQDKIQREIDELTRNKHNVRRDVEAEEARLAELRRQRQELEGSQPPPPPATPPAAPPPAAAAPVVEGRPEPKLDDVDENGDARYANYEAYLSDHAKWGREEAARAALEAIEKKEAADRARIEHESASRAVNERLANYNTRLEEFKKTHADFDAAFEEAKEQLQDTLVAMGPQALKIVDGYTVFDAEDGPALSYYLLKHPDELKAIAAKAPPQQLVHLARLEERIRPAGGAKRTGSSPVATERRAPEPIQPVGSGPTATTLSADEESYQDYRARRERELRARRGY